MLIEAGDVVLFQGDSITDCGRNREDHRSLGSGYPLLAAGLFGAAHPGKNVTFLNRGISGNRVKDLSERWDTDCLALEPSVLSVYIGINDTWRRYDADDPTSVESYEEEYRKLLDRAWAVSKPKLVLVEPFVLPHPADREAWREDLDPKIAAVRRIAREYNAAYVALDGLFAQASTKAPCEFWAEDGVHPSPAGHALIAKAWLEAVGAL